MIKANELRFGNIVMDQFGYPGEILKFTENCIWLRKKYSKSKIQTLKGFEGLQVFPVPLDPEWLERSGFEKTGGSYGIQYFKLNIMYLDSNSPGYLIGGPQGIEICRSGIGACLAPVRYVHQLQNLYYSLTGKELNYTI